MSLFYVKMFLTNEKGDNFMEKINKRTKKTAQDKKNKFCGFWIIFCALLVLTVVLMDAI